MHQTSHGHPALLDLPLGTFLDALASSAPTPGGGAAAALCGAAGAALVEMTASLTVGRERFAAVEDESREIAAEAGRIRQDLQHQAVADARAYDRLSAAYKLPRGTDAAASAARLEVIQGALQAAADVPLEVARLCARLLRLCERAAPILNPAVVSDVLVGAHLSVAAMEAAGVTVEVNLNALRPGPTAERVARTLTETRTGVPERLARTLEVGRERMPRRKGG